MLSMHKRQKRGFTLIELTIVLTIAGLLFVGLWRLLSGGNQQVRDQSAAASQQQLIAAVKSYMSSGQDLPFVQSLPATPGSIALTLPTTNTTNAICRGTAGTNPGICDFLPAGFTASTPNSYGQIYKVRLQRNDQSAVGTTPTNYSFMILTSGGDTIPDASGGRISSFIGGDGGFIYSTNVCNAQTGAATNLSACGAYGTWASSVATYGFGGTVAGEIASRTFVSPSTENTFPWLARLPLPPDPTYGWNTMTTDLFMGTNGNGLHAGYANITLGPYNTTTGGGALFANGGSINMGATGLLSGGGQINLQGGSIVEQSDVNNNGFILMQAQGALHTGSGFITATTNCTRDNQNPNYSQFPAGYDAQCKPGIQVNGDEDITGQMNAWDFYSQTFIYSGSDIRFKTDVHPIASPLADVMRLKPVSYRLKSTGQESMGVIAQDLEKVYPQLVADTEGTKAVEYDGLIAPLIGAIQELKQQNDELRHRLDDQSQRQKALEEDLRRLQSP